MRERERPGECLFFKLYIYRENVHLPPPKKKKTELSSCFLWSKSLSVTQSIVIQVTTQSTATPLGHNATKFSAAASEAHVLLKFRAPGLCIEVFQHWLLPNLPWTQITFSPCLATEVLTFWKHTANDKSLNGIIPSLLNVDVCCPALIRANGAYSPLTQSCRLNCLTVISLQAIDINI